MLPNIVGLSSYDAVGHRSKVAWGGRFLPGLVFYSDGVATVSTRSYALWRSKSLAFEYIRAGHRRFGWHFRFWRNHDSTERCGDSADSLCNGSAVCSVSKKREL